jgi:hypothetical protein
LLRYDARAADPDADPLTFDLVVKPAGMGVDPTTELSSGCRSPIRSARTSSSACRTAAAASTYSRSRSRSPAQPTPVITSAPRGPAVVGVPYQYQALAQDADGDPITFRLDAAPTGMTINAATGLLHLDARRRTGRHATRRRHGQ